MDPSVKTLLLSGAQLTDAALERLLPSPDTLPHSIHRAMRHSVFAGGKRLRPILCMEAARMVATTLPTIYYSGELPQGAADLGAALEMLHTYSLIRFHDDLPPLDHDDLRRGQPTCQQSLRRSHRHPQAYERCLLQTLAFHTASANLPCYDFTTVRILREVTLSRRHRPRARGRSRNRPPPGA